MSWWQWLFCGALMLVSLYLLVGALFVLCGPPVRQWRPEDQEQAQRRARRTGEGG